MRTEQASEITLTFNLPIPGKYREKTFHINTANPPQGRAPRVARLVALAHRLEGLVRSGAVTSYGELACLSYITPPRLSQILLLAQLAPTIQEYVLFLSAEDDGLITELGLRKIARELLWDRQCVLFEKHINRWVRVKS
jgi:hypothetical protein